MTTTGKKTEDEIPGAEQLAGIEERVRTHMEAGRVDAAVEDLSGRARHQCVALLRA